VTGADVSGTHDVVTLRAYADVVARRKWVIAATLLLSLLAGAVVTLREAPRYAATAEVLLSRQNPLEGLTTRGDQPSVARRSMNTQARVARSPIIAERTLGAAGLDRRSPHRFLAASSVQPVGATDVLGFVVEDRRRARAARLATEYAAQYLAYRRELDSAAVQRAQASVNAAIGELDRTDAGSSDLRSSLEQQQAELRALETTVGSGLRLVSPATTAHRIRPEPAQAAFVALGLGLIGGVLLGFLCEALDTRVRSSNEIRQRLGRPILARVPPRRRGETRDTVTEATWSLRTNFELASAGRGIEVALVTGSARGAGTSTVAAELATALACSGRRVVLADLDLRQPSVARRFGAEHGPGVAEVATGEVALDDALVPAPIDAGEGSLLVLPAGGRVHDPAALVSGQVLPGGLIDELRARADLVLIDAPALLEAGEAMALTSGVDAVLVVVRLGKARRPMLGELRRSLDAATAGVLGVVVTGGRDEDGTFAPDPAASPALREVSLA
jgi:non-specific protein-tyrosine kinase